MEDTPHKDDQNTDHQLTENFFMKSEYMFHLDSTNNKFDDIIAHTLTNTKAYEQFFNNFNQFALASNFLAPKERDFHCSHEIILTK